MGGGSINQSNSTQVYVGLQGSVWVVGSINQSRSTQFYVGLHGSMWMVGEH